ncbi:putative isomerase YddE [Maioricimonas rarisocia]|uniref:Putative isomerase YddE n=1 Tax=Maioricimonas rarisocia TaxID=2528026 RepID=A0A517Z437_9PLAN|nr:PhzF family phenazine biosynthesis protein [Maioricimonas rarisocia]QDU37236.1 putative isomerase YddE [Maioricimonas rarisocia]
MSCPLLQVDAFTDRRFRGNPAAVCLLEEERGADWMQAVAAEMNLAETAFVRPLDEGFELRWFTPRIEVDLCGHATLASAHALWEEGIVVPAQPIRFHSQSGVLTCTTREGLIELDFPATPAEDSEMPDGLVAALWPDGDVPQPMFVGRTKFDVLVVLESATQVRGLDPDFRRLAAIPTRGVMVTAPTDRPEEDFLSRFFAPAAGIDEDPVTGSAHCCLGPYWAGRLGKAALKAHQASRRGGEVAVRINGDRVVLGGQAVTVLRGELL